MAEHDPFAHDPGMKELHQRDYRNLATPIHAPVVQHNDFVAAEKDGRLEDTTAMTGAGIEGDGAHAVAAAESIREQIADREARAFAEVDDDQPLVDDTTPDESGDESPLNAYGNVAPEHAIESGADRDAALAPQLAPAGQSDPTRVPGDADDERKGDSELATDDERESAEDARSDYDSE